jgi:hypothetical protein
MTHQTGQALGANASDGARVLSPAPQARSARGAERWTLPGFCWNGRITTSFGDMPVQGLRLRDPVRTNDGAFAAVAWIDQIHLDEDFLNICPDAQPVLIRAGALGSNNPKVDVTVSAHQKVCVTPGSYSPEFRYARDLTDRPGILRKPELGLTYYLFHCGKPAAVMLEGLFVSVTP